MVVGRTRIYHLSEDDKFHRFGDVRFNHRANNYQFSDVNQPPLNRYQGFSHIESGVAKIYLRNNSSSLNLSMETHEDGWVDLKGNIFGANGQRQGYITDEKGRPGIDGSGRWYELWLKKHSLVYALQQPEIDGATGDRLVGAIVEPGRAGTTRRGNYSVTARAAGFLLLYEGRQSRPKRGDTLPSRTTWKDTALPASVLFVLLYVIFYLSCHRMMPSPSLTGQIAIMLVSLAVYFAIWGVLRELKIEADLEGRSIDDFLMLIDRNTGQKGLNNGLILLSIVSIAVSVFFNEIGLIPIPVVIFFGVLLNSKCITGEPWAVLLSDGNISPLPVWRDDDREDTALSTETVERFYKWTLDSPYYRLDGEIQLSFNPKIIEELRKTNPFRIDQSLNFYKNTRKLFDLCTNNVKVHQLLKYIDSQVKKANLGEMERMQFILDFVQMPNIQYELDKNCDEIGNLADYARFPDETLFDGRGDCDCKAVLAAILFREAGYKTAYIILPDHAAIGVALNYRVSQEVLSLVEKSALTNDGYLYYFCETTGDGFRIGDLGSTSKSSIEHVIYLN